MWYNKNMKRFSGALKTIFYKIRKIKNKTSQKGFTLIEVLVSIAIITILASILLPGYNSFRYRFALLRSSYKLSHDFRGAQEFSVSAKELPTLEVPPGYGIYLKKGLTEKSYILYADNGPYPYGGNEEYDLNQDIPVETIKLESGVYIKDIVTTPLGASSSSSELSVNFRGPDPLTKINGKINGETVSGETTAIITLGLTNDDTITQQVFVNKVGLIYVLKQ
jgi:prepilin-type N-terminal cleavage/methylation domain-containing protein